MRTGMAAALALPCLILISCATTDAASDDVAQAEVVRVEALSREATGGEAPAASAGDPDEEICKRRAETGSRFLKTVCKTRAEWDRMATDNRKDVDNMQRRGGSRGW